MTTKQWTELVHVTAHYFQAGEQPWTEQEWYLNTEPNTVESSLGPLDMHRTLLAPQDSLWWQQGYLWWTPDDYQGPEDRHTRTPLDECVDDQNVLIQDVVRFSIQPLDTGCWHFSHQQSMLVYECEVNSLRETFQDEALDALKSLTDILRVSSGPATQQPATIISVLTVWQCEHTEEENWTGSYSSYDWRLLGYIAPRPTSVAYVPLKQKAETT